MVRVVGSRRLFVNSATPMVMSRSTLTDTVPRTMSSRTRGDEVTGTLSAGTTEREHECDPP
jgi:hypothetical protein